MALATLGGLPLTVNPNEIRWNFSMKTFDQKCMGGKVIQILGTTLSDITLRGTFGQGDRSKGDKEGWQNQLRFREQVEEWTDAAAAAKAPKPLRFTYSPRKWDFQVYLKSLSGVELLTEMINPPVELVMFPVDKGAADIVRGIKDLYLQRLMDGVGWKQGNYNGPTQAEVDAELAPYNGSVHDYYQQKVSDVFTSGESPVGNPHTSVAGRTAQ